MKKPYTTNYREAWIKYRKSAQYKRHWEILQAYGYKPNQQRYANNLLQEVFNEGWGNKRIYQVSNQA